MGNLSFCDPASGKKGFETIAPVVDTINHQREMLIPGQTLVIDESMCAWLGGWTSRGAPPSLVHIPRKPVPKGIELKTLADGETGIMLRLEVQVSQNRLRWPAVSHLHPLSLSFVPRRIFHHTF